jgi:preprotein translocase subunit SecY
VLLLVWLGDLISRHGIGPGIPLIIATPVLAALPRSASVTFEAWHIGAMTDKAMAGLLAAIVATVLSTVFVSRARYRLPIGPVGDESARPLFLTLIPAGIVAPLCVMTAGYALDRMALTLIRLLDPHFSGSRLVVFVPGILVFLMATNVFGPLMRDPAALAHAVRRGGGEFTPAQIRRLTMVLGAIGGALLALFVELPDIVAQELLRQRSLISGSQLIIVALVMLACLERVEAEER